MENLISESAKVLKEKRQELIQEMKVITDKLTSEKRNITEEENKQLSELDRQQEEYAKRSESLEKVEHVNQLEAREFKKQIISAPWTQPGGFNGQEERAKAVQGWLYHGSPKQTSEQRRCAERELIDLNNKHMRFDMPKWDNRADAISPLEYEKRTSTGQAIGSNGAGNYTVALDQSLMGFVDVAMKWYGQIFQTSEVYTTSTGAPMNLNDMDDTSNLAVATPEGSGATPLDFAFTRQTLNAYKYTTAYKMSYEFMEDSALPVVATLGSALGERMGRLLNSEILNGQGGGNNISGVLAEINLGFQSTSTESGGILYTDLVSFIESIDEAYLRSSKCGFMFNQNFRSRLRNLLDQNDRPLIWSLVDSLATGLRNVVLDYPYYINADMPSWGHTGSGTSELGNHCAVFGDLSKIKIRRVGGEGYNIIRDDYTFLKNLQTQFILWGRFDAIYQNSGKNPLKTLQSPNS